MASEYFLKKAKEEYKPREVHIMTAAERRKSRWYYHKRQIIIGAFFGICIIIILWNVLGIGKAEPDYTIAYVGSAPLSCETA